MGVRVVFPDMGKDPSVQLIEKTITENGTYDALTDGANGYSKVNVNVEGGGGSSDFSTAEVMIVNNSSKGIEFNFIPVPITNHTIDESKGLSAVEINEFNHFVEGRSTCRADSHSTETFNYLFAKESNFALQLVSSPVIPDGLIVSGNAEKSYITENGETHEVLLITGDCTINLSTDPKK